MRRRKASLSPTRGDMGEIWGRSGGDLAEGVPLSDGHRVALGNHGHDVDVRLQPLHELDVGALEAVRGDEVEACVHLAQRNQHQQPPVVRHGTGVVQAWVAIGMAGWGTHHAVALQPVAD